MLAFQHRMCSQIALHPPCAAGCHRKADAHHYPQRAVDFRAGGKREATQEKRKTGKPDEMRQLVSDSAPQQARGEDEPKRGSPRTAEIRQAGVPENRPHRQHGGASLKNQEHPNSRYRRTKYHVARSREDEPGSNFLECKHHHQKAGRLKKRRHQRVISAKERRFGKPISRQKDSAQHAHQQAESKFVQAVLTPHPERTDARAAWIAQVRHAIQFAPQTSLCQGLPGAGYSVTRSDASNPSTKNCCSARSGLRHARRSGAGRWIGGASRADLPLLLEGLRREVSSGSRKVFTP